MEKMELIAYFEARGEYEAADIMREVDNTPAAPTYPWGAIQRQILSRLAAIEGYLRHRTPSIPRG